MVKFEVTDNEQLTRTFLDGLADAAVLSNRPLKQGEEKVTLKARGEHGQCPSHNGGTSEGRGLANASGDS